MRLILKPWGMFLLLVLIAILASLIFTNGNGRAQGPGTAVPVTRQDGRFMFRCEACGHDLPVSAADLKKIGVEAVTAAVHDTVWDKQGALRLTAADATPAGANLNPAPPVAGFRREGALELGKPGDAAGWTFKATTEGKYRIAIRYANPDANGNALRIYRQGTKPGEVIAESIALPRTGGKGLWEYVSLGATLDAGENVVRIATTGTGRVFVDGIVLEKVGE